MGSEIFAAYDNELKKPTIFFSRLHILSMTDFFAKAGQNTQAYQTLSSDTKKHLIMLDGLSILLVSGKKGDCVAVTILKIEKEITFMWCQNDNPPKGDTTKYDHVVKMFKALSKGTEIDDLVRMVVPVARLKIIARIQKLVKEFDMSAANSRSGEKNLWFVNVERSPQHKALEKVLQDRDVVPQDQGLADWLDHWIRAMARMSQNEPTVLDSYLAEGLIVAWYLVAVRPNISVVTGSYRHPVKQGQTKYPARFHRLKKLADYMKTCGEVRLAIQNFSKKQREEIRVQRVCKSMGPTCRITPANCIVGDSTRTTEDRYRRLARWSIRSLAESLFVES